jgi:hypothetical protein
VRTQLRYQITVQFSRLMPASDSVGDKTEAYSATKQSAAGSAHPVTSKLAVEMYGQRIVKMKLLILTSGDAMQEGDGVWLPGETASTPPWRCVSAPPYTFHQNAIIERRA